VRQPFFRVSPDIASAATGLRSGKLTKGDGNVEILVVIVAFWLILVGGYGILSWLRNQPSDPFEAASRAHGRSFVGSVSAFSPASSDRGIRPSAASTMSRAPSFLTERPAGSYGVRLTSEVDLLRAQVEHLRTELSALSETRGVTDRPRMRRYGPGSYSHLPRPLRRSVREVRSGQRIYRA
jgi:hypothetical protein